MIAITEKEKNKVLEKLRQLEKSGMRVLKEPYFENGEWKAELELVPMKLRYKNGVIG